MGVDLKSVAKKVGTDVHIHETDLSLESGGFNVLLGTTLSGKTTLMRIMAGLEAPTSGEVWFDGVNVTGIPVQKRSVAMVYQQFINYPNFTVFDNIASPMRVSGVKKKQIRERVQRIAELLKLDALLDRMPNELSGGQQQRTALARALVKNAKLVLLDEPLANLDYKLREELRDELPRLFADTGATVVYATTEPVEALLLGGHTATLHEGTVTQYDKTTQAYRTPANLLSAQVFSDPPINTASVTKLDNRIIFTEQLSWLVPESMKLLPDGTYTVGIRPHHVQPLRSGVNQTKIDTGLSPTANEATAESTIAPGVATFDAQVKMAEISGSESVIHIQFDKHHWVCQARGVHSFALGEIVSLSLQVDRCLYFDKNAQLIASTGVHTGADTDVVTESGTTGLSHPRG